MVGAEAGRSVFSGAMAKDPFDSSGMGERLAIHSGPGAGLEPAQSCGRGIFKSLYGYPKCLIGKVFVGLHLCVGNWLMTQPFSVRHGRLRWSTFDA